MQIKEFLDQASSNGNVFPKGSVTCFAVKDAQLVPILFLSHIITGIRAAGGTVESLDLKIINIDHVFSKLQTSFLGMGLTYYIRSAYELDKKSRQLLFGYLAEYSGPHTVLICGLNEDVIRLSKQCIVEIPDTISVKLFQSLLIFFKKKNTAYVQKCITSICSAYSTITLDQAYMLLTYMQVISKYEECSSLFDRILESEKSLFLLSQHFFAKDASAFFELWQRIGPEYPMAFWCTYWGEQLWRAYFVRYYLSNQQTQHAKSIGYRLPFSYLQKDWKKNSLRELKMAHQSMYELDIASKNSIESLVGIEIFYTKFLQSLFS